MASKSRHRHKPKVFPRATSFALVLLDPVPIRKRASQDIKKAQADLTRNTRLLEIFEQTDLPAFERWRAQHFGAMLTEFRDLAALAREKAALLEELEMEYAWAGDRNPHAAYCRVMQAREDANAPFAAGDDDDGDEDDFNDGPSAKDFTGDEAFEDLFRSFARDVLGIDPDTMDPAEYEKFSAAFRGGEPRANPKPHSHPPQEPPPPRENEARLKSLYRELARRLHPDSRDEVFGQREKELWLAVQSAYQAGDLEQLEVLAAKADLLDGQIGDHTSVSQLLGIVADIRASLRSLRRRITEAKKSMAWGFSKLTNLNKLHREYHTRLKVERQHLQWHFEAIQERIAFFADPPRRRVPRTKKPRVRRAVRQDQFPF